MIILKIIAELVVGAGLLGYIGLVLGVVALIIRIQVHSRLIKSELPILIMNYVPYARDSIVE